MKKINNKKSYNGKINALFRINKKLKQSSKCIFVSVILIYSVCRKEKINYPQAILEECKHFFKRNRCLNILLINY